MPRENDGTYVLPPGNPVASGTVITSTWANTTMTDIASALTDSLDRYGRGGMEVPFQFTDGSELSPGMTWLNEPSSGWYRAGTGDMRVSLLSQDVFRLQGGQASIWANAQWNELLYSAGSGTIPDGTADWQSVTWNNSTGAWTSSSAFLIDDATGNCATAGILGAGELVEGGVTLSAKYLGIDDKAADSDKVDGYDVVVGGSGPGTDASTLYFRTS